MLITNAEIKLSVTKKEFLRLYGIFLEKDKKTLDIKLKEQIVYFADNKDLDFYHKHSLALRYRWSNRGLEVVVKKRGVSTKDIKKIKEQFNYLLDNELKFDIDQISDNDKTVSCILRCQYSSIDQSFAFYQRPEELLSKEQKRFLKFFINKEIKDLRFLIPVYSKAFMFPLLQNDDFESIVLEERRMPKLFENKFYEVTLKTSAYSKKTMQKYIAFCDEYNIHHSRGGMYKTQWLYNAYFDI